MAPTIELRSARRRKRARKASPPPAAPRPQEDLPVPFFLAHGRAWINGREVGGADPRFAHLDHSYD